jgi:hypothetical protein
MAKKGCEDATYPLAPTSGGFDIIEARPIFFFR